MRNQTNATHVQSWQVPRRFARYGVPPHRFQTLMRLDRARALLSRGMPIIEVATRCGFSDQSHLTRHFRRYLQLTPGMYHANGHATG